MNFLKILCSNQFVNKSKTSCKNAFFVVNEGLNYYKCKKSKFFIVSLDTSKAFDKLWRHGLFYKLIEVADGSMCRILFKYNEISKICV